MRETPVGGIKLKMNNYETSWVPNISVEDAGEGRRPDFVCKTMQEPRRGSQLGPNGI